MIRARLAAPGCDGTGTTAAGRNNAGRDQSLMSATVASSTRMTSSPPRVTATPWAPAPRLTRRPATVTSAITGQAVVAPNGVIVPRDRTEVALLLAPRDDNRTLVHVLVVGTVDAVARIAASREVESLRRKAEALQNEGATP